ncbi:MAG: PqqD family protein [Bacteroidales bacterium]
MKIKEEYKIETIGNDKVLLSNTAHNLNYTKVMVLNPTAAFLLEESGHNSFTNEGWANMLVERYAIDRELALADANTLIEKLQQEGVLE